ncbi:helix-turn-helix domain-containing protein [Litoribacter ruber]|uniref:Helix-turn-helix domain-containing protein n=1 Tax=Litoribacter ruber TaxID=702568 RepID=A0AAP2CK62_9BACT|nr:MULTISPECIES: helix-turn-helix domain-containing protein [Litoribacter]MBS9524726.1 helix-turn-helix domain-containing protein [Litoribacter alkaliphilus]MBT0812746.1 helix-turn-helix domain-containing protein [Litoribacter ruber]
MNLGKNIRFLRKSSAMTQEELSERLGVKRTMISAYEDGRSEPKLPSLQKVASIFNVSLDDLIERDLETQGKRTFQSAETRILTVTLDKKEEETIPMISQKASAGYLNGYSDPEYMEQLPQFNLPNLPRNASYRGFEISGDSMLPILPGTVIIGSFIDDFQNVKSGKTYVLVTGTEGIVYKRLFNYLEEKGTLLLVSDNEQYKPYEIAPEDVLEIWEAKAFISTEFPHPKDKKEKVTLEDLSEMISDLKSEIIRQR